MKRMPLAKDKVAIVVLNWNNWKDTIACLESVFGNSYPNYQVIVVDNGSTDCSEEKILQWANEQRETGPIPYIRYGKEEAEEGGKLEKERRLCGGLRLPSLPLILVQTGKNLGYSGGNNVALRFVLKRKDCAYVWLLNNDTVIDRHALAEMVELARTDDSIGMIGSKCLYIDKPHILQAAGGSNLSVWTGNSSLIANDQKDNGKWDEGFEPDYICGASLLVRKEVIDAVGLLDESYFLYWEDADWGLRARRMKFRLLYCPGSRVWHREGGTSGGINSIADYYWTRNGLFFVRKFYPLFLPTAFLAYFLKYTLIRAMRRQPLNFKAFAGGVFDFIMRRYGELR